jgi:hypothetical protein
VGIGLVTVRLPPTISMCVLPIHLVPNRGDGAVIKQAGITSVRARSQVMSIPENSANSINRHPDFCCDHPDGDQSGGVVHGEHLC